MNAMYKSHAGIKKAVALLSGFVEEIGLSSEVHIDLSEETREDFNSRLKPFNTPTGKMILIVSWIRGRDEERSGINEERISEIALEIEEEMGRSGLTGTVYEEFALRVTERYISEWDEKKNS